METTLEELKRIRMEMLDKLKELKPAKSGGVSKSAKYPDCVWIDFPETQSRIAFFEDARIDEEDGNFHSGRIGYATFFKNMRDNGGACKSSNDIIWVRGEKKIVYNLNNRRATGIKVDEAHIDEIIEKYKEFMLK